MKPAFGDAKNFVVSNSTDDYTNFRIVGQEKDGSILFVWDSRPINSQVDRIVTHIALNDTISQEHMMLFVYDRVVHIVNCTVNPRRSLIAFTTLVTLPTVENGAAVPGGEENIYKAYTAEILPQNKIYKMYIEDITHIQLQFLYPRHPTVYTLSDREPKMLMMQHRQSIGLYTFPMARVGDKGVILCNQPRTESLLNKYSWSQWDPVNQRLYVLHPKKLTLFRQDKSRRGDGRRDATGGTEVLNRTVLTCFQFDVAAEPYEIMLEMPLPLPLPKLRQSRPMYHAHSPTLYTPDSQLNIRVVTTSSGSLCVCYQHPVKEERSLVRRRSSASIAETPATLEYSVCMIHHGKTLLCSVPNMPTVVAEQGTISFTWACGYLIAFMPGQFIHFLNVGIELEPSHHIIMHHPDPGPFPPNADTGYGLRPLVPIVSDNYLHCCFLDTTNLNITKIGMNRDQLFAYFCHSRSQAMRLAILHHAVLHARDVGMVKKMFQHITADPANPELNVIFQEFLTASTYGSYKRSMAKSILDIFPFTTVETFRGQFERSDDRKRTAQISYSTLPRAAMVMAADVRLTERGTRAEEMWRNLGGHLVSRKYNMTRFRHRTIEKEKINKEVFRSLNKAEKPIARKSLSMNSIFYAELNNPPSLLRKMTDKARSTLSSKVKKEVVATSRPPSTSEQVLGPAPFFLSERESAEDADDEGTALVSTYPFQLLFVVSQHLEKHKISDDKGKLKNLAMEYVTCMMLQTRQLCHVVWSVFNIDDAESTANLRNPATETEMLLFQVFERLYLAVMELAFPLPAKFLHYFIILAFRVLDIRTFLQYVNSHVLILTPEFMILVIGELDDSPGNVEIKTQLISKLDMACALECYRVWNHPVARKHVAGHLLEQRLTEPPLPLEVRPKFDKTSNLEASTNFENSFESISHSIVTAAGDTFPPLDTLMRLLREAESRNNRRTSRVANRADRVNHLTENDYAYIEETALLYTRSDGHTDVTANF